MATTTVNPTLASSSLAQTGAAVESETRRSGFDLSSEDFFKLLVTQLTNQDPMQPTSNEEMLKQISSIREIELSSSLTESLQKLSADQRWTSSSTLIGQYVTAVPGLDGNVAEGIVVGVRLVQGTPALVLSNGAEVPIDHVAMVQSPEQAANALIGREVMGFDRTRAKDPGPVGGVVTAMKLDDQNQIVLELDTGKSLRLEDVISVVAAASN